jgi:hypothetical protein
MDISYFSRQISKILTLFRLRAGNMTRPPQNIEAKRVIGKMLRTNDLEWDPCACGVIADFGAKFAHMPYSLARSVRLSKGRSSQP